MSLNPVPPPSLTSARANSRTAAVTTTPPSWVEKGGTSVHPPARSRRTGAVAAKAGSLMGPPTSVGWSATRPADPSSPRVLGGSYPADLEDDTETRPAPSPRSPAELQPDRLELEVRPARRADPDNPGLSLPGCPAQRPESHAPGRTPGQEKPTAPAAEARHRSPPS